MKFGLSSLVPSGASELDEHDSLRWVVERAAVAEDLGFDAYGVGERHDLPFLSSSPPVLLAAMAERTRRLRLFTSATVIGALDPVRAAEDYATVDQLSGGRLDLMIAKGSRPELFLENGLDPDRRGHLQQEKYALLRRLWSEEGVTWSGSVRAPLDRVTTTPRPYAGVPRIWHAAAGSAESAEFAASWGDPLFTDNGAQSLSHYAWLVSEYRARWAAYERDPHDMVVGAGTGGFYVARTSQEARRRYEPIHEARVASTLARGKAVEFSSMADHITRGSLLVGSPAELIEMICTQHEALGHQVQVLNIDDLPPREQTLSLELFMAEVAPTLRAELPTTIWDDAARDPYPAPAADSDDTRAVSDGCT